MGRYPDKANICIVGAGAIGGLLGVHLSLAGHTVTFVARGAHLAAMQERDAMQIIAPSGDVIQSAPGSRFVDSARECGEKQDVVVLGLKMHQIAAVMDDLPSVMHEHSFMLTTQNGIPWWYFQNYGGPSEFCDRTVEAVDPDGKLRLGVDANRLLASVVYPAAHIAQPGVVKHVEGVRFPLGELSGAVDTPRVLWMSQVLIGAGFKAPVLPDVRAELWLKLWGTVAVNPLSALTHASLGELCARGGPGRGVVEAVMEEVRRVAARLGATMRLPVERRVDGAARMGAHKTSMLQDVEAGRDMEIDAILGAVVELARVCGEQTPCIDVLDGTIRMLQKVMRDERAKICLQPIEEH